MHLTAGRTAHDGYAALAPLYDEFIAHPGYRHWVQAIEATARTVGVGGVRLLDIGCGTGRSFAPLLERGYLVAGCEPVEGMLVQARRRSPRRVRITHGLVAAAPAGPFDLVLALNDVLQCIPTPVELRETLAAIAARLADDGVFAFDVTPPRPHARQFAERVVRTTARAHFEWCPAGPAGPAGTPGTHLAHLRIRRRGGDEAVALHRQRTIGAGELASALTVAGLEAVAVRGCDNAGRLAAAGDGAFKHIHFCRLTHPRGRKEVPDAAGAQAPPQGRRHAVDRQAGLTGRKGAACAAAPAPAAGDDHGR